jgi:hypothetical protein
VRVTGVVDAARKKAMKQKAFMIGFLLILVAVVVLVVAMTLDHREKSILCTRTGHDGFSQFNGEEYCVDWLDEGRALLIPVELVQAGR